MSLILRPMTSLLRLVAVTAEALAAPGMTSASTGLLVRFVGRA